MQENFINDGLEPTPIVSIVSMPNEDAEFMVKTIDHIIDYFLLEKYIHNGTAELLQVEVSDEPFNQDLLGSDKDNNTDFDPEDYDIAYPVKENVIVIYIKVDRPIPDLPKVLLDYWSKIISDKVGRNILLMQLMDKGGMLCALDVQRHKTHMSK